MSVSSPAEVAPRVVDRFEIVDVDHDVGERTRATAAEFEFARKTFCNRAAIQQARQRVDRREFGRMRQERTVAERYGRNGCERVD